MRFVWAQYQMFPIKCQQNSAGAHSGWICDLQWSSSLSNITRTHAHTRFCFMTHTQTTLSHQHTHTIIAALFIQLALWYSETENRNKAFICFLGQTGKKGTSGKKNRNVFNFEALPTEWKPINKYCIILQLNGTVIKIAGFQRGHFCP